MSAFKNKVISLFVMLLTVGMVYSQCEVLQQSIDSYIYTQGDFGQSFKPCANGEIYYLEIPTHHFQQGDISCVLSIYEGQGYGEGALYTSQVTLSDEWGSFLLHELDPPLMVDQSLDYTVRIDYLGEYGVIWANFSDIYEEGTFYWDSEEQPSIDMGLKILMTAIEDPCISWTGTHDNNWNDPLNWDLDRIPGQEDCVKIEASDFGNHPVIVSDAYAYDITVSEGAQLELQESGRMNIFHDLIIEGQAAFNGEVLMKNGEDPGEIIGSPVFKRLTLEGLYFMTEPITILDILDVEHGYLANLGTEVVLEVDDINLGHAYIPGEPIAGPIIIKRELKQPGYHVISMPGTDVDMAQVMEDSDIDNIVGQNYSYGFESFQENWQESFSEENCSNAKAIYSEGSAEVVIRGEPTNSDQVIHTTATGIAAGASPIYAVGNPYPSIIDWARIEMTPETPLAIYEWISEKQQYGAYVGHNAIHGMDPILNPTDVVMIQIPEHSSITLNYDQVVLNPEEALDLEDFTSSNGHNLRLALSTISGTDETMFSFDESATRARDLEKDALKIPSRNAMMPTFASYDNDDNVLSINAVPYPHSGDEYPLYLDPGQDGKILISASMIDIGGDYGDILLEDKLNGTFHDLMTNGAYQTNSQKGDPKDRFSIHFQREPNVEVIAQSEEVDNSFNVTAYSDEFEVRPFDGEEIEVGTMIRVHSLEGKLVFEQKVMEDIANVRYKVYVSPGLYSISVQEGNETSTKKAWLD